MSKISRDKKKTEAKAKVKGKQAKIAQSKEKKANKPKKQADEQIQKLKASIPNYGKCCKCKSYTTFPEGIGHMCKKTKKSCPRKSTCDKYSLKD